jgi:hypothetical protein
MRPTRSKPGRRRDRPTSPRRPHEPRHQPNWFLVVVVSALVGAIAGAAIGHKQLVDALNAPIRLIEGSPSIKDQRIASWVDQARAAPFWAAAPTVDAKSVAYLHAHYRAFDPTVRQLISVQPALDLGLLVQGAPLYAGTPVRFAGRILDEQIVGGSNPYSGFHDWQLELNDPRASKTADDRGVIYCRMTLPADYPLEPPNSLLAVSGIAIAQGSTRTNLSAVYVICNGIAPIVILSPHHKPTSFGTL